LSFIRTEMVQISTMNSEIDGGEKTNVVILDRGMNRDECKASCTSPKVSLREKLFFRILLFNDI
jgi:hypothetical protein